MDFLMLIFVILVIIIVPCIIGYYISTTRNDSVTFVSKKYMDYVVQNSPYFKRMSREDLQVRQANNEQEYISMYISGVKEFTEKEKDMIRTLITNVEIFLERYKNINSISWKICKMSKDIERGFPHTLEDVIVLSDNFFDLSYEQQMLILVHEKIHIFQRLFPAETNDLVMNIWKFEIKKTNPAVKVRNNPDLNDISYGKGNFYTCQMYRHGNIDSITDSDPVKIIENNENRENMSYRAYLLRREDLGLDLPSYISQIEHPFEIMGSYLPYIILQRLSGESKPSQSVLDWLERYF